MYFRSGKRVQIDNVDYNTKLVMRPVQRGDSGEFTITASNSSGRDSVTVTVTVTDKPSKPQGPLQVCFLYTTPVSYTHLDVYKRQVYAG